MRQSLRIDTLLSSMLVVYKKLNSAFLQPVSKKHPVKTILFKSRTAQFLSLRDWSWVANWAHASYSAYDSSTANLTIKRLGTSSFQLFLICRIDDFKYYEKTTNAIYLLKQLIYTPPLYYFHVLLKLEVIYSFIVWQSLDTHTYTTCYS